MREEYTVTATGLIKMTRSQIKAQDTDVLMELYTRAIGYGGLTKSTARMLVSELNRRHRNS